MDEELQIRIHGSDDLPTLIYLPGMHGDWTLIGPFRRAVAGQVRFVEFTYPRTLTWSLDDHAAAIENALAQNQVTRGWLLGESFGSQIAWAILARGRFPTQGIILAGGFVRHPLHWLMRLAAKVSGQLPFAIFVWAVYGFAKFARFLFRRSPERLAAIAEFVARRNRLDAQAATHRMNLVAESDPRPIACATRLPVFCLSGFFDPIVQWPLVRRWLKKNCPALRGVKIIPTADHPVLTTGANAAAKQILEWIK